MNENKFEMCTRFVKVGIEIGHLWRQLSVYNNL